MYNNLFNKKIKKERKKRVFWETQAESTPVFIVVNPQYKLAKISKNMFKLSKKNYNV